MNCIAAMQVKMIVLLFLLGLSGNAIADDQLCGAGPAVEGNPGDAKIRLRPLGTVAEDHLNLQWAVDNVVSGGIVELCEGEFYLGVGKGVLNRKTVTITQGIKLEGKKVLGEWLTVIKGGGSLRGSSLPDSIPDPHIGPFLVESEKDTNPVTFENVWLREWLSEAIVVTGCNGFNFINSKITEPVVSGLGYPARTTNFIHAILISNPEAKGDLILTDNEVDLSWAYGDRAHDTQFIALFGHPKTAFTYIEISRNTVIANDEVLELTSNDPGEPSQIIIEDNNVDVHFDVEGIWPYHFAFFVANNKDTDKVLIRNNTLNVSNDPGIHGKDLMGVFVLTGENFEVTGNVVNFDNFEGKAIQIGNAGNFHVVDFGRTMNNSLVENNQFTGVLDGTGIDFFGGLVNSSKNNIFRLGDSLAKVTSNTTIDTKGTNACGNVFEGDTGIVEGDIEKVCSGGGCVAAHTRPDDKVDIAQPYVLLLGMMLITAWRRRK